MLVTIIFAYFFHAMASSSSQTSTSPSSRTWITIELVGFIKPDSDSLISASSTRTQTSLLTDKSFSSSMPIKTFGTLISGSSTPISTTLRHNSSSKQPNSRSHGPSLDVDHPDRSTEHSKSTTTSSLLKMTTASNFATIDVSRGTWTLPQNSALKLEPVSYYLDNLTSAYTDSGVNEYPSASAITPFSYFPGTHNTSSNMSIFTGLGMPYYLALPRYVVILISALPLVLLILV